MTENSLMTEAGHNRLLRRLDWRFLLNNPKPGRSICFGNDSLTEALSVISDQVFSPGAGLQLGCDLAAAFNPDSKTLQSAWQALKPGGALYAEWSFRRVGHIRRLLGSAGFRGVQCYWSWPPAERSPLFWAPLGAHGAWRYLLASRPRDRQWWRHWVRWLLRSAAYLAQRLDVLSPVYALAYKLDLTNGSPSRVTLIDWLRAHWHEWPLGSLPDKLSLLFLTGGLSRSNKVVALVFAEPDAQPLLIVKLPRVPESVAGLQREAGILQAINAHRKGSIPGVPKVVFQDETRLGETVINGVPLFTQMNRGNYQAWTLKATNWLIDLAGEPRSYTVESRWSQLFEPIISDFLQKFDQMLDRSEPEATRQVLKQIEALPSIIEHRDFSPWNVLITSSGGLGILDWESAELNGLPLLDLIYFLTYLTFFVEGAMETRRFDEVYRRCWSLDTTIGQVNNECVRRYCDALQLDVTCLPALRLFTWLLHSRSEYKRLIAASDAALSKEKLGDSLFFLLWRVELRSGQAVRSAVGEA